MTNENKPAAVVVSKVLSYPQLLVIIYVNGNFHCPAICSEFVTIPKN